jgi:hypothetical protein
LSKILDYLKGEPVLVMGTIQAGLGLGLAFGLHVSADQIAAILVFSAAALSLVVRQKVTPVS